MRYFLIHVRLYWIAVPRTSLPHDFEGWVGGTYHHFWSGRYVNPISWVGGFSGPAQIRMGGGLAEASSQKNGFSACKNIGRLPLHQYLFRLLKWIISQAFFSIPPGLQNLASIRALEWVVDQQGEKEKQESHPVGRASAQCEKWSWLFLEMVVAPNQCDVVRPCPVRFCMELHGMVKVWITSVV